MNKLLVFFAGTFLTLHSLAQDNKGLSYPESIISDGRFLYVSNVGKALAPFEKDGDGFISKLSLQGEVITRNITTEKLNAPKGSAIIKGVLYVADIDRIVGIDLSSGKKTADISLGNNVTFANDVAVKDDHTLFVSATDVGKIFEVNIKTSQVKAIADVKGANGIYYDKANKKLYTCSFFFDNLQGGEVGVVSWTQQQGVYSTIADVHGGFDGIALADDHTLLVSDWGALDKPAGFLQTIDLNTKKAVKLDWPVIGGPADFYYDAKQKKVIIPAMVESKVVIQSL
jgi:DNA-binding beta-propeller fold protein YncE